MVMNSEEKKQRILERTMEVYPKDCHVVPYSTPVVSFGDPNKARVATLGINPSCIEFLDNKGNVLSPTRRRLVDTNELGLDKEVESLDINQAQLVVDGCYKYFETGRHYDGWFGRFEKHALNIASASYFSSSDPLIDLACHLDIVQWATDPVWNKIENKEVRKKLLANDIEFLRFQLTNFDFKTLFLNGRQVVDQFKKLDLCNLAVVGSTPYQSKGAMSDLYHGFYGKTEVWGWSLNLQSQVTNSNLNDLSENLNRLFAAR
jgi:hypothetical protein